MKPFLVVTALMVCATVSAQPMRVTFKGAQAIHKWTPKELGPDIPSDWSGYEFLVIEMRTTTPQRFHLVILDKSGPRRLVLHPFGQNVWFRAAVPLKYFKARDQNGQDLASVSNKPTHSFWISLWGPFGPINQVQGLAIMMDYPLNHPVMEIRSVRLSKEDPGSEILEKLPVIDEFGQWIHTDWPRKIRSLDQLKKDWAEEEKGFTPAAFDYCKYSGFRTTKAKATGFFRVEQIDGKWWFVDPDGHLYLSMAVPSMGAGGAETRVTGREAYYSALPPADLASSRGGRGPGMGGNVAGGQMAGFRTWNLFRRYGPEWRDKAADMELRRAEGWGLTSVVSRTANPQESKPYLSYFSTLPRGAANITMYLGMPDVYSAEFAQFLDESAKTQLAPRKDDPFLIGYFIGNEPPWPRRESELVDMFLAGPPTAMQREIKSFLAQGDTPERRRDFVMAAFEKYLAMVGAALKKYDPNHLNLGIRFGGNPPDYISRTARAFDVYSVNTYEYEPTKQIKAAYELSGRPVIMGEFHFGVPADGLGAGLVQVANQKERGVGYRYYVEQAAALPYFVGAGYYTGVDESVSGRNDGENYNIGFVDVTDRAYPELVSAAKETLKRLLDVHLGKKKPFNQRPKASEAGTPQTPWTDEDHGFRFNIKM
jgi:hypothetical protein